MASIILITVILGFPDFFVNQTFFYLKYLLEVLSEINIIVQFNNKFACSWFFDVGEWSQEYLSIYLYKYYNSKHLKNKAP